MRKYAPVNLAFDIVEPISGRDETLTPIIFLHGCFESKELWHDIPKIIADRTKRRTYIYDARNHGDSEWSDQFSFKYTIDDLNYFMDSNNIPKAILIGNSMGGYTASRFSLMVPERVELLIIEDMHIDIVKRETACAALGFAMMFQEAVQTIPKKLSKREGIRFALDDVYRLIPIQQKNITPKETLYKYQFPIKRNPDGSYDVKHNMKIITKAIKGIAAGTDEPRGIYTGPTSFIYGDLSPINVNNHEEKIRKHFPYAKLTLFEGATHNLHLEFPEKFADTILEYFTEHYKINY